MPPLPTFAALSQTEWLLAGLAVVSLVTFLASLVILPLVIAYMPADYFQREPVGLKELRPIRLVGRLLKNLLGAVLLLGGIAMLFLPGQGLLTIFLGSSLIDFPGKRKLEQKLIRKRAIERPIVWIRRKAKRPPLQF
ncbi:PGPGW domain-containing protein [Coraliomargarita parva]|uniref:PGPGW domain-containing protein n=1 Tax=Coraliomargarita parva TaxID=3014050 RepID=UPI0022B4F129|nr:PGPGW domain-containing protein [Coraliomargarita parva]